MPTFTIIVVMLLNLSLPFYYLIKDGNVPESRTNEELSGSSNEAEANNHSGAKYEGLLTYVVYNPTTNAN